MQNNFSYENNQQCDLQMNYDYYPQQPHNSYGYQQQIFTPTFTLDIRLIIRQLNYLYPISSFLEYE